MIGWVHRCPCYRLIWYHQIMKHAFIKLKTKYSAEIQLPCSVRSSSRERMKTDTVSSKGINRMWMVIITAKHLAYVIFSLHRHDLRKMLINSWYTHKMADMLWVSDTLEVKTKIIDFLSKRWNAHFLMQNRMKKILFPFFLFNDIVH